jgi:hypothetical protein
LAILTRHQQQELTKDKNNLKTTPIIIHKKSYPSDIQFELDSYKRPQQKIALLCGSPGAGVCHLIQSKTITKNFLFIENNSRTYRR